MSPIEPIPSALRRDKAGNEVEMTSGNVSVDSKRTPSNAEKAMSANAHSRDRQGRAEDRALHERRVDMTDRPESPLAPEARSIRGARQGAEVDGRGTD